MDVEKYIASGIIENYCLGYCSPGEIAEVEAYALSFPAIRQEIEKVRNSLEAYFMLHQVKPAGSVKISVMLRIYKQLAATDAGYPPLIEPGHSTAPLKKWIAENKIPVLVEQNEDLCITGLPSTSEVTNFIAYAKTGHGEEVHTSITEYLYVVSGSCIMDFGSEKRSYREGDIIAIMPGIPHSAIVTSNEPMIALVQRQACAWPV